MVHSSTLTIGARIIGCVCLIGAMMISTQIGVELLHYGDPSYSNLTRWSLETVDMWTVHHLHQFPKKESHLVAIGTYVLTYAMCSGLLIYASYTYRRLLAIPWLLSEGTCILCEASALVAYFARSKKSVNEWQLSGAIMCICIAILMWCVVYEAQSTWTNRDVLRRSPPPPPPYSGHRLEQPAALGTPRRPHAKMSVV